MSAAEAQEGNAATGDAKETSEPPSSGRFRFKSKSSRRGTDADPPSNDRKHHRHHHSRHHRHKRRKVPSSPDQYDPLKVETDPNTAFRESLFDALGDDEGAAYWEGVYGQPIHTFADQKRNPATGKLETMTEDEYVAFVRKSMWDKSVEGIEAEKKERRRQERRERQQAEEVEEADRAAGMKKEDEGREKMWAGLRKSDQRQEVKKHWGPIWNHYEHSWDAERLSEIKRTGDTTDPLFHGLPQPTRDLLVWPVESAKRRDITYHRVREFVIKCAESRFHPDDINFRQQLFWMLKTQRVRWHPDKMQQRYGGLKGDEAAMNSVTEVFQIMDRLYEEFK